jgi:(p)ppGpp synthase/HD superfamily hydrolase
MHGIAAAARAVALRKHGEQKRPDGRPIITHLDEVAELVTNAGGLPSEIAAAYLHDALEDTELTTKEVADIFGVFVADTVAGLTQPKEWKDLPTIERKMRQAARVRTMSCTVQLIKLADQTSILRAMVANADNEHDRSDCAAYIEGARRIASNCRESSIHLYSQFMSVYEVAVKTFGKYEVS